jgi:DNA-binding CsgD family transcriptional regulator
MRNPDSVVDYIVKIWNEHFKGETNTEIQQKTIEQLGVFDQLKQSNLQTVVFSFDDLSILYINEAAGDFFDAKPEEIKQGGAAYIISCFDPVQLEFATRAAEQNALDMAQFPHEEVLNSYTCYANWIINTRKGRRKRGFFRIFPIQINNRGLPLIGMYLIHDLTPFVKEESWWYRACTGNNRFVHYHSEGKKLLTKDLLSEREKVILSELALGLSSKEIGEKLNLSSHTVDNHRRRMLSKTGALDTSALLHVAKLTGFI